MAFQRVQQSLSQNSQTSQKTSLFVSQSRIGHIQSKSDQLSGQNLAEAPPVLHEFTNLAPNYPHQPLVAPIQPKLLIQPKLTIAQPGDKYEQEADRVADRVVQHINTPPPLQYRVMPGASVALRMKPETQLRPDNSGLVATPALASSIQQARGGGQPLAENVRRPMEQALGADFSQVKVHTDGRSDQLNRTVQSIAFTAEQNIFFRQGAFAPGTRQGQELIAHELTHVMQQGTSLAPKQMLNLPPNPGRGNSPQAPTFLSAPTGILQLKPEPARVTKRGGAGLHKSNRKAVEPDARCHCLQRGDIEIWN
ncbi:DUF4157 domain-containing protein [Kovacikia minuta CCNUW1]|uniref:eCIS core domain-containing protein n=1 Tax=Kovacikia minuta TaxID=2931930 RepID=UPI001CCC47CD|nr:DUF4157 domain-containing protein [Kovacikia minuta]UBF26133.1 DUF4157 domain-containing protein [Kovacikia minuta CCNUW1]